MSDSDIDILNATLQEGKLWVFPALGLSSEAPPGASRVQQADWWCKLVRSEHERQAQQITKKDSGADVLGGSGRPVHPESGERSRDGRGDTANVPIAKVSVQEYVKARIAELGLMQEECQARRVTLKANLKELSREFEQIAEELRTLRGITSEDAEEVGESVPTEVRGGG